MEYFGLQSQIRKNNLNSVLLLLMFPLTFYGLTWLFLVFTSRGTESSGMGLMDVNRTFLSTIPWITVGVGLWFLIAWFSHTTIINAATNSNPRKKR